MSELRISEIFYSLQGESNTVGLPTVFVRLTGCPLRCNYCDTSYAFSGGVKMSLVDIVAEIQKYDCKTVCVTGGEPLAQPACLELLTKLTSTCHKHKSNPTNAGLITVPNNPLVTDNHFCDSTALA